MLKFEQVDVEQMVRVQECVTAAVLPYRQNTEAALVIFALVRVARTLLRLYAPDVQTVIREQMVKFLNADRDDSNLLLM